MRAPAHGVLVAPVRPSAASFAERLFEVSLEILVGFFHGGDEGGEEIMAGVPEGVRSSK